MPRAPVVAGKGWDGIGRCEVDGHHLDPDLPVPRHVSAFMLSQVVLSCLYPAARGLLRQVATVSTLHCSTDGLTWAAWSGVASLIVTRVSGAATAETIGRAPPGTGPSWSPSPPSSSHRIPGAEHSR